MAKKRANGEGNVRKRSDGRWEGRYTSGYNADTGKRIIRKLVSGLRKGELVAPLWSDMDTAHNTISVSKQYVRNPNGECVLSQPKTENSVRLVSIP